MFSRRVVVGNMRYSLEPDAGIHARVIPGPQIHEKRLCLRQLWSVGVCVAADCDELTVEASGLLSIPRERGGTRRAVEPVEAVGRAPERGLELAQGRGRFSKLKQ